MRRLLVRLAAALPPPLRRFLKRLPGTRSLRGSLYGKPSGASPGPPGSLRPVVYLPTWVHWDVMRQRPQYLLQAFDALGHPVYFVDPHEREAREVDGVRLVPRLDDVPSRHVILYVHFAPLTHLFDRFEDPVVVYDILDDLSIYDADEKGMPEERRVRFHHPNVMDTAEVVIVSNRILAEKHRTERPDLIVVSNGVDFARFSAPAPDPGEIPTDRGPVIGYHGMISYWFDFDLLAGVADLRPDWLFVLVGPTDPGVRDEVERLQQRDNILLLGEQPSDRMPGYVQRFDVGAIWFQVTEMTQGVTPLKMYEYLAAGVPCVATPLPACVDEEAVATADSPDEFASAIAEALENPQTERLQEVARAHTWSALLEPVQQRLEELGRARIP